MPKKAPRNAFYFFMLDYKARCERNGERFPRGLSDVQGPAGEEWNVLPPNMKKPYEEMAKAEKLKGKQDTSRNQTCALNSFSYIDRMKREEEENKKKMDSWIENTIKSNSHSLSDLAELKFYVIHANYLCLTPGGHYHAVEVAVAEFCLKDGVTQTYHEIIDPGKLPSGYSHDANLKTAQTHKIPQDYTGGQKDKFKILTAIKKILEPGRQYNQGNYPPMFTMPDNIAANTSTSCVKNLMQVLCESTEEEAHQMFAIYNVEKLFYELKNSSSKLAGYDGFHSLGLAKIELERDINSYVSHIACYFHQDKDAVEYCSLSYVQRWIFLMCDHCCEALKISMVPGKHCPKTTDVHFLTKKVKEVQAQKSPANSSAKKSSFDDRSKKGSNFWNPVKPLPLPTPTTQSPVVLQQRFQSLDISDEDFPAMAIGRGRGRPTSSQGGPSNYAAAMKRQ